MSKEIGFPRELLGISNQERLNYFRTYTIAHPHLVEAYQRLNNAIYDSSPGTLIFFLGPTGTGKTTIRLKIEREIKNRFTDQIKENSARIPIIGVTTASPESGSFNWKDFYRRILLEIDEPCVDHKAPTLQKSVSSTKQVEFVNSRRVPSAADLRYALETILKHRKPVALLIDDAQHLAKLGSGRKLHDQLDIIKSLGDLSGLPIVLFGTYELVSFRNLSGQISRRSIDINLWRYRYQQPKDIDIFKDVLWTFQKYLPLNEEPNLLEQWELFYERSIGCVGILKEWLTKALMNALREPTQVLKLKHIQEAALSVAQCQKMLAEALEGENRLIETRESRSLLRSYLGLPMQKPIISDDNKLDKSLANHSPTSIDLDVNTTVKKKKRKSVQRKERRDPVGRENKYEENI